MSADDTTNQPETITSTYASVPRAAEWRSIPIDADMWERCVTEVGSVRKARGDEALERGVNVAMRAAAVDTGAIEGLYTTTRGLTVAVATQEPNWEAQFAERGPRARALYEAQLKAFGLARQLATARIPLSEAWIRQLHTELLTPQLPDEPELPLGQYKTTSNKAQRADLTYHVYAAPERVPGDTQQFIEELRSESFRALHPSVRAAFAHFGLTAIHPFQDGNGRVARTLASAILFEAVGLPLVIYLDQRDRYLDALEAADNGDFQPFATFVFERALDTIRLVTDEMKVSGKDYTAVLRSLMTAQGGLSHGQMDELAQKLVRTFTSELDEQVRGLGPSVAAQTGQQLMQVPNADPDYRSSPAGQYILTVVSALTIPPPASASVAMQFYFLIAKDKSHRYPLRIVRVETQEAFDIRLSDVYPEETADLKIRLRTWLRRAVDDNARQLAEQAESNLKKAGYK
jgi:Fic family protein